MGNGAEVKTYFLKEKAAGNSFQTRDLKTIYITKMASQNREPRISNAFRPNAIFVK